MPDLLNNFLVRNREFYQAMLLELGRRIEQFNAASNNTIRLSLSPLEGNYETDIMQGCIPNLISDRDLTSQAPVAESALSHVDQVRVKYARRAGPVDLNDKTYDWILQSRANGVAWVMSQMAESMPLNMFDRGVAALVAAMSQHTNFVYDGTSDSTTTLTRDKFAKGEALLGDQYQEVVAFVMHSKPFFDLRQADLVNAERLFVFETLNVFQDTLGRPFIVIDSPALVTPGSPNVYHVLGLTRDAIEVSENGDYRDNLDLPNGEENLKTTWQAQWTENIRIKGHSWDTSNGGTNPNAAAITTASNWDLITGFELKRGPGVMIDVN